MAVSQYFNHITHPGEQKLVEDTIIEAIQHRGVDVYYINREVIEDLELFNEAVRTKFSNAKIVEMYVESITNFNGAGDMFNKFGGFGFEDSAIFVVSKKRFKEELLGFREEPQPGDLIYLTFADQLFEVQKRLEDEDYRQVGINHVYRIRLTKFRFGHEDLDTGVASIDDIENFYETLDLDDPTVTVTTDPRDVSDEANNSTVVKNDILDFGS